MVLRLDLNWEFEKTPYFRIAAKLVQRRIQSHCEQNRKTGVKYFLENGDIHVEGNRKQERINWSEEIYKFMDKFSLNDKKILILLCPLRNYPINNLYHPNTAFEDLFCGKASKINMNPMVHLVNKYNFYSTNRNL